MKLMFYYSNSAAVFFSKIDNIACDTKMIEKKNISE